MSPRSVTAGNTDADQRAHTAYVLARAKARLMSSEAVEGELVSEGGPRARRDRIVPVYVINMEPDDSGVFCTAMGFGG